ncbi:hypothetical protein F5884DRAFT_684922 [Xylogone sp. PMI_703]|nr:hypothetical protein F5884DRAFT_684922 [Xylogone sp. PMI_703]
MAAPPEITLTNLNGKFALNKSISDDVDPVLALQGVGWLTRKAISFATITLSIKEYLDDASATHIDIEQTATGGIKGTTELRTLDWTERAHEDHIFGNIKGKSRFVALDSEEIEDGWLKEGWLPENEGKVIQSVAVNEERGWTALQIWGFAEVEGKRYYARRVRASKGEEVVRVRMYYDYQGE